MRDPFMRKFEEDYAAWSEEHEFIRTCPVDANCDPYDDEYEYPNPKYKNLGNHRKRFWDLMDHAAIAPIRSDYINARNAYLAQQQQQQDWESLKQFIWGFMVATSAPWAVYQANNMLNSKKK